MERAFSTSVLWIVFVLQGSWNSCWTRVQEERIRSGIQRYDLSQFLLSWNPRVIWKIEVVSLQVIWSLMRMRRSARLIIAGNHSCPSLCGEYSKLQGSLCRLVYVLLRVQEQEMVITSAFCFMNSVTSWVSKLMSTTSVDQVHRRDSWEQVQRSSGESLCSATEPQD